MRPASWIVAAVVVYALAMGSLRMAAPTYPVGDGALLEIYTLHAAHGALTVGAYSRFQWHHPGPALFYLFAPGYMLSHHAEASLLLTTLILNVSALAGCLLVAWRWGDRTLACALAAWFVVFYAHPGNGFGWEFGDLLSNPWNPLAPILPLALVMLLAAAVGAGRMTALPVLVGVASVVSQAHVAFIPVSLVAVLTALLLVVPGLAPPRWLGDWAAQASGGPRWLRVLDTVAAGYAFLCLVVLAGGGTRFTVLGLTVSLRSPDKLLLYAVLLVGLRLVLRRDRSWLARPVGRATGAVCARRSTVVIPVRVWTIVAWSGIVAAVLWLPPLVEELSHPGAGNLVEFVRSVAGAPARDLTRGLAAFARYLSAAARPGVVVAAGGRTVTADDLSVPLVAAALLQLGALVLAARAAARRGQRFRVSLAVVCLTVSLAAWWSMVRVRDDLYDHLGFWIAIVGVVNLGLIAATGWDWLVAGRVATAARGRRIAAVAVAGSVAGLLLFGLGHIVARHQQTRFPTERGVVERLWRPVRDVLAREAPGGRPLLVDMDQDAWSAATGLVLQLYRAGVDVHVTDEWTFLFGDPLASTGREGLELTIASPALRARVEADPAYRLVATDGDVFVFARRLAPD